MNDIKSLYKGKWDYNLVGDTLISKNKDNLIFILKNKDNLFFQDILSTMYTRGKPNPELMENIKKPEADISLEQFHRIMRSNEIIYEQKVILRQNKDGLFCSSEHLNDFQINHHNYDEVRSVSLDPHRVCKITRRIRDRERVYTKLRLEYNRIVLFCEFPWAELTIILPTIMR